MPVVEDAELGPDNILGSKEKGLLNLVGACDDVSKSMIYALSVQKVCDGGNSRTRTSSSEISKTVATAGGIGGEMVESLWG